MKLRQRSAPLLAALLALSAIASARAESDPTRLELRRIARIHAHGRSERGDIEDAEIRSPKSVRFSADGRKVYINALEAGITVVYEWPSLRKLKSISHRFTAARSVLFNGETTLFDYVYNRKPPRAGGENVFLGKPVESELSHGGRYLWIPYYRRSFDTNGTSPSALAIVDTSTDEIVRVMPAGPIPKYVAVSPDGRHLAVTHWGDNSVAIMDISSQNPADFHYERLLVVGRRLDLSRIGDGVDRDQVCGYCLRGTAFAPDNRTLLVARMGGGGIAGFDVPTGRYLGTVVGMRATPRHILVSRDGDLFVSSNSSGYVSKIALKSFTDALARGPSTVRLGGWTETFVGSGARTIALSPDERYVYAAVNVSAEVVALDAGNLRVLARAPVDPFTVGLAVSADGSQVWTTSQGRAGRGGGNSVGVYSTGVGSN
jgi:DNA-binding beta-propeller fold protein YncE